MNRTRTAGFSLIEMAVVMALLGIVLGAPLVIFRSADRMRSTITSRVELQALVRQTVDRIAGRLEGSSVTMVPQSALGAGVGSAVVDFQVGTGWNGAAVTWGAPERLELLASPNDPNDSVDNDADGMIDERIAVWTTDVGLLTQRALIIRRDVPEFLEGEVPGNGVDENGNGLLNEGGLVFEFSGDQVVIRLSLEGRDNRGARIVQSEERRIAFRN